jgi:RNA polymerase sigma factor (TIGR02999 family)
MGKFTKQAVKALSFAKAEFSGEMVARKQECVDVYAWPRETQPLCEESARVLNSLTSMVGASTFYGPRFSWVRVGWIRVTQLPAKTVSELLANWHAGDDAALRAALPLVYDELRHIAHRYLQKERPGHTLQSTALVHEAYLRLEKQGTAPFQNREHFLAICAQLMRQILVDYARSRNAARRDGGFRLELDDALAFKSRSVDMVALDDALNELAKLNQQQSHIVELRFFGGLSIEETSRVLNLSPTTVKKYWAMARLWLHHQMAKTAEDT